ncbi:helix-turn-helix domain-containing protein [Anaerotignum sp.]|uniref:helix-turn-helix domain-containing protein n=1 Tax=Anaerotignum sp. TaxID=2039241 RepID=UPI00289A119C|nr:helix-turn-helix domain-containing protein [Anaerotignum sp.]
MRFYTVSEIGDMFKVSRDTVSEWIRKGKIGAVKIGGTKTVRISESDLNKFLADNRIVVQDDQATPDKNRG